MHFSIVLKNVNKAANAKALMWISNSYENYLNATHRDFKTVLETFQSQTYYGFMSHNISIWIS